MCIFLKKKIIFTLNSFNPLFLDFFFLKKMNSFVKKCQVNYFKKKG